MDQSFLLCIYVLSITTLFTDINSTGNFVHNWFDAQNYCLGQGLTIERNKSNQPYWTGVYCRLTPWINILGCYPDSFESLQYVVEKTMTLSSVGMCQEICRHENIGQFAVKMNNCLCFERDIRSGPFSRRLPASDCNFKCEDNSDNIYSGDCGGENAYNLYETQGVHFNSLERCLSLQCSAGDTRFLSTKCFEVFEKVCENMTLPDNGYATDWSVSMEQCKNTQPSSYLLGDIDLNDPRLVCERIPRQLQIVWVGVVRQSYTSIDQGWGLNKEQRGSFLECQICEWNDCQFRRCSDLLANSIFCQNILVSDSSQDKPTSQKFVSSSTLMSHHSRSDDLFASSYTTGNYEKLPSTYDNLQKAGASANLFLKISLPVTVGFIVLLVSIVGVVLYKRRSKMTKSDRTTNEELKSVSKETFYSELDFSQSNSSVALEHCYQKISKGSNSLNESPYYNLEEGVNDHLRANQAQETGGNIIYHNASTDITENISGYKTITNANNKNKEGEPTYDHLHQGAKDTYWCDFRVYKQ